jgi:hypothetical protein
MESILQGEIPLLLTKLTNIESLVSGTSTSPMSTICPIASGATIEKYESVVSVCKDCP